MNVFGDGVEAAQGRVDRITERLRTAREHLGLAAGARIRAVSVGQSAFADTWLGPARPAASRA